MTSDADAELRAEIETVRELLDSDDACAAEIQWHLDQARKLNAERAREAQQ